MITFLKSVTYVMWKAHSSILHIHLMNNTFKDNRKKGREYTRNSVGYSSLKVGCTWVFFVGKELLCAHHAHPTKQIKF